MNFDGKRRGLETRGTREWLLPEQSRLEETGGQLLVSSFCSRRLPERGLPGHSVAALRPTAAEPTTRH